MKYIILLIVWLGICVGTLLVAQKSSDACVGGGCMNHETITKAPPQATYADVLDHLMQQVAAQQDTINQLTTKTLELDNTVTLLQQRVEALEEKESK